MCVTYFMRCHTAAVSMHNLTQEIFVQILRLNAVREMVHAQHSGMYAHHREVPMGALPPPSYVLAGQHAGPIMEL
jgi:hypothetical protein